MLECALAVGSKSILSNGCSARAECCCQLVSGVVLLYAAMAESYYGVLLGPSLAVTCYCGVLLWCAASAETCAVVLVLSLAMTC